MFFFLFQSYYEEKSPPPELKDYDFYKLNGMLAEEDPRHRPSNGIKGLFAFANHPHAHLITATTDYMHAYYNIIHDALGSTRPTNSGDTKLSKHVNRTYKDVNISACEADGFHKKLWTEPTKNDVPPWVFTKAECIASDKRMKTIIGPPGTSRIKNVMKSGKGQNTHDTLEWAFVYARWCWAGKGERIYVENLLDIFEILCIMTASTMKRQTVK